MKGSGIIVGDKGVWNGNRYVEYWVYIWRIVIDGTVVAREE
jgi:endo-alpha-1,4-polygalactosaminidase (GH114 family)